MPKYFLATGLIFTYKDSHFGLFYSQQLHSESPRCQKNPIEWLMNLTVDCNTLFLILHATPHCKQWQTDQSFCQSSLVWFLQLFAGSFATSDLLLCTAETTSPPVQDVSYVNTLCLYFFSAALSVQSLFFIWCPSNLPPNHVWQLLWFVWCRRATQMSKQWHPSRT